MLRPRAGMHSGWPARRTGGRVPLAGGPPGRRASSAAVSTSRPSGVRVVVCPWDRQHPPRLGGRGVGPLPCVCAALAHVGRRGNE
jgi:hypothetical protein